MLHLAIIVVLTAAWLLLVRKGWVQVDMSFPWYFAILLLGVMSTTPTFVGAVASLLGIVYPPIAIVLVTLFIVFGLLTVFLIALTTMRSRLIGLTRQVVAMELAAQESQLSQGSKEN